MFSHWMRHLRLFLRFLVLTAAVGVSSAPANPAASKTSNAPWSGAYVDFGDWIFHARHGWQYWPAQSTDERYFYDSGIGVWGWSTPDAWPAVYFFHEPMAGWYIVDKTQTSQGRLFFHPRTGSLFSEEFLKSTRRFNEQKVPPRPIYQPAPHYPPELLHAGIIGEVTLEFVVTYEGTVRHKEIVEASHDGFIDPVLEAASQWLFLPGEVDGAPVNTRVRIRIPFRIAPEPEPPPDPPS